MNIEDFISRYIDGELDSESEADLHHRLAVSPEARAIFRAQIALRAVARDSRVLVTPTPALRNRLFERLEEEEGMGPVPPPPPAVAAAVAPVADTLGDVPRSLPSRRLREEGRDRRRRRALALLLLPALLLGLFFVTESSWRGGEGANVAMKSSPPLKNGDAAASEGNTGANNTTPSNPSGGTINGGNTDIAGDALNSRSGALSADGTGPTLSDAGSSRVASRKSGYTPSSSWTRPSQRRSASEGMASRLDDDRVTDESLKTLPATTESAPVSAKASAPAEERDIPLGTSHSVQPSRDSLNDLQQQRADSTSTAHTIASLSDPDRELAAPPRLLGPDPDAIAMASSSVPPSSAPPPPPADGGGFSQDMSQDMKEKDLMMGALAPESKPSVAAKPMLADNARGSGKGVREQTSQRKTLFSPLTMHLRLNSEMRAGGEFDFHRQLVAETALEFAPTRRFLQAYGWRATESKSVSAPRPDYLGERMQVIEPERDGDQMLGFGVWYYFLW